MLCLPLDPEKLGTWGLIWLPRHGLFPEDLEPLASVLVHGAGLLPFHNIYVQKESSRDCAALGNRQETGSTERQHLYLHSGVYG